MSERWGSWAFCGSAKRQDMPFGPTRQQAKTLASPERLAKARKGMVSFFCGSGPV
ncbi:hypothetical protein ABBQ32_013113 [Trebouxia sp. C0010 RCD-2024]